MTEAEKVARIEKIIRDDQGVARVVACYPGTHTSHPSGLVDECFVCDQKVLAYKVTVARKADGWLLLCIPCWQELVRKMNAQGRKIYFGGRIADNKIPPFEEPK